MKESPYAPIHVNMYNYLFHWHSILTVLRNHSLYLDGSERPPFPLTVEVNPIDFCNHECVWCFTRSHRESDRMRKEVLELLLQQLKLGGVKSIHFAGGGEATLYKGLLPRAQAPGSLVQEIFSDNKVTLGLITNGSVFQLLNIDDILRLFSWIRFSVDAGTEERYEKRHLPKLHNLEHVYSNISNVLQARGERIYPIIGSSFIFEDNLPRTYEEALMFARNMAGIGVDYIQIKPENSNQSDESLDFLSSIKKDLRSILSSSQTFAALHSPHEQGFNSDYCWYSYFGTVVGATGGVYVCCYTYGQEEFEYGSLYDENDFMALWGSEKRRDITSSIVPTKCPSCRHNNFNVITEKLYKLPYSIQDELSNIISQLKCGKKFEDMSIPVEIEWLRPGFAHVEKVISVGYNRILDFPVYRDTDFVRGV